MSQYAWRGFLDVRAKHACTLRDASERWPSSGRPLSTTNRSYVLTTPDERSRALVWAGGFLIEVATNSQVPKEIRQKAVAIARHFPTAHEIDLMARYPGVVKFAPAAARPEWVEDYEHGPLTDSTRLR